MTNVDGVPPVGAAPAVVGVAESLSTVGYAMFALLQTGPLDQIASMSGFMAGLRAADPTHPAAYPAAAAPVASPDASPTAYEPVEDTGVEEPAFGASEVDADLAAITHATPAPADDAWVPQPDPAPAEVTAPQVEQYPQPTEPVVPVPEYTGNQTLAMLQEISFLDE